MRGILGSAAIGREDITWTIGSHGVPFAGGPWAGELGGLQSTGACCWGTGVGLRAWFSEFPSSCSLGVTFGDICRF
jgi:hypothetical protein